jgi:uncharacterized membrane protein YgcG
VRTRQSVSATRKEKNARREIENYRYTEPLRSFAWQFFDCAKKVDPPIYAIFLASNFCERPSVSGRKIGECVFTFRKGLEVIHMRSVLLMIAVSTAVSLFGHTAIAEKPRSGKVTSGEAGYRLGCAVHEALGGKPCSDAIVERQNAKDFAAKDAARDKAEKGKASKDKATRDKADKGKASKDNAAKDKSSNDNSAKGNSSKGSQSSGSKSNNGGQHDSVGGAGGGGGGGGSGGGGASLGRVW